MNRIFRMIGILCITGFVTGVFTQLIPGKDTEKTIKLVAVLYVVSAVFNTDNFSGLNIDYTLYTETNITELQTEEYITDALSKETEAIISERLTEKNIYYEKVDVHINKETDKMYIESITVYGADETAMAQVKAVLSDIVPEEKINQGG